MTGLNQVDGDEAFDLLVHAYEEAGPDQGQAMLARVCVLLAQKVGSIVILREILEQARKASPNTKQGDSA